MGVVAITPINHGLPAPDYGIVIFSVGEELTTEHFTEAQLLELIAGGSAVEIGNRVYTEAPTNETGVVFDETTHLRDALIAQSQMVTPAATEAEAAPATVVTVGEGQ